MKKIITVVLCFFVGACARHADDSDKPISSSTTPASSGVSPTPANRNQRSTDMVSKAKDAMKKEGEVVMNQGGTSSLPDQVDESETAFGARGPIAPENLIFSAFGLGGAAFVIGQQLYRYREKQHLSGWEIARSGTIGFIVAGLCASTLVYLRMNRPINPKGPVVNYHLNVVVPPANAQQNQPFLPYGNPASDDDQKNRSR
jgi:hypothetical protein